MKEIKWTYHHPISHAPLETQIPEFKPFHVVRIVFRHEHPPNIRLVGIVRKRISGASSNDDNQF